MHKMNDARSVTDNNARFEPSGVVRVSKGVPAADLRVAQRLEDMRPSELLASYGAQYWSFRERLCGARGEAAEAGSALHN